MYKSLKNKTNRRTYNCKHNKEHLKRSQVNQILFNHVKQVKSDNSVIEIVSDLAEGLQVDNIVIKTKLSRCFLCFDTASN